MNWATPTLRRNVDLPPELAPVMMTSGLSSACTSLPTTTPGDRSSRHASRRPVQVNAAGASGAGSGMQVGAPFAASLSARLRQPT